MMDSAEERTVIDARQAEAPSGEATVVVPTAAAAVEDRTQMAMPVECPVCHSNNPTGETYCGDCGFLLESTPGAVVEAAAGPRALLVAGDGREFALVIGRNAVGRQNADVLVADSSVSRTHAAIVLEEERCWVEDLGSTNGTMVNGQRLAPVEPRYLANGDEIKFGSATLRVVLPEDFAEAPAPSEEAAGVTAAAGARAWLISEESSEEYPLPLGTATIGRRSVNAIAFPGDLYLSGRHAEISFDGQDLTITDAGSTNGTVVNEERLEPNVPRPLRDGDLIVIGQQRLRARVETAPPDDGGEDEAAEAVETEPADVDVIEAPEAETGGGDSA